MIKRPDPWKELRDRWPRVGLFVDALEDDLWGYTDWAGEFPSIILAFDLGRVQRRCTLAHEIQHLEYGKPCRPECPDDEERVIAATARWLLPDLAAVGRALVGRDVWSAAAVLDVTRTVLMDRLEHLTDAERVELARLLHDLAAA